MPHPIRPAPRSSDEPPKNHATQVESRLGEARARFLEAAQKSGARLDLFPSRRAVDAPNTSCDIVHLGAPSAETLFVLIANTPGASGLSASALFSYLLEKRWQKNLARNHAMMMIHAVNPHGAVWPNPYQERGAAPVNGDAASEDWTRTLITAAEENYQNFLKREQETLDEPAMPVAKGRATTAPWNHRFLDRLARSAVEGRARVQLLEVNLTPGIAPPCFRPVATTTTPQSRMQGRNSYAAAMAQAARFDDMLHPLSGPAAAFDDQMKFGAFDAAIVQAGCDSEDLLPAFEAAIRAAMTDTVTRSPETPRDRLLQSNRNSWLY